MKFFVAAVASMVAAANGQLLASPLGYAHAGLPLAHPGLAQPLALGNQLTYAAAPAIHAAPIQPLTYAAAPAPAIHAAPIQQVAYAAAPAVHAAPAIIPAAPTRYAVPPPREIQGAPIVNQVTEKVEQHGYKIKY